MYQTIIFRNIVITGIDQYHLILFTYFHLVFPKALMNSVSLNTHQKRMYAANQIQECYVKIEKLTLETITLAQYGIKECFVKFDRIQINDNNTTKNQINVKHISVPLINHEERCDTPKKLMLHVGSVRSHCKWLPTKKSLRNSME